MQIPTEARPIADCQAAEQCLKQHDQEKHALLTVLLSTVQHFFGGFRSLFQGVTDPREEHKSTYPLSALLFAGVFMFLCRLGSRRQIGKQLRHNGPSALNLQHLFGVASFPHGDTLNDTYARLRIEEVQATVTSMTETLMRQKVLAPFRLCDRYYVIVVDGTGMLTFSERHCPHCLTQTHHGTTHYYHHVLEAKVVTPNGFVCSLMTEFIENPGPQPTKQDCELKAFYRLARRLKQRFPRLPICLSLDSLFAGGPTLALCEQYQWKYLIVLNDHDIPSIHEEFEALAPLQPANHFRLHTGQEADIIQEFRWVDDITYMDSAKKLHTLSVLHCRETKPDRHGTRHTTQFKWITNHHITATRVVVVAHHGGRHRWKIENEGFHVQKNGGFALEHAYTQDVTASKIFYFLWQIAHLIAQLIEKGSLFRQAFPQGVGSAKNIAFRLLEAWRNCCVTSHTLALLRRARFQIRFDTS